MQIPVTTSAAVIVEGLTHRYGDRVAVDQLNLSIPAAEIVALLGPNGSGKTTLFRIFSTLMAPQQGQVSVLGLNLPANQTEVRRQIGVVFQSPSLDRHLTAAENLRHQGHLYGLAGRELEIRIEQLLGRFSLLERASERVERFSGGMRRRVELAKGLLHRPRLLILDEPSTGLDPRARAELMEYLRQVQRDDQVSVVLTTHLMEEAEQCDRLAIMDRGKRVAEGSPEELKRTIGGHVITLRSARPRQIAERLRENLSLPVRETPDGLLHIEHGEGHTLLAAIDRVCPEGIDSISVGRPTLMDVFIHFTGRNFGAESEAGGNGL